MDTGDPHHHLYAHLLTGIDSVFRRCVPSRLRHRGDVPHRDKVSARSCEVGRGVRQYRTALLRAFE